MSAFIGRPHGGSVSEESACKAVDAKDVCSVPGSGRSPGGGNGNPLQHSCLENPLDRGAWRAAVHGVRMYRLHHQHQGMPGCQDHLVKRMPSPGTLPGWGTLTRPRAHPQSPGDLSGEELKAGHRSLVSRRPSTPSGSAISCEANQREETRRGCPGTHSRAELWSALRGLDPKPSPRHGPLACSGEGLGAHCTGVAGL